MSVSLKKIRQAILQTQALGEVTATIQRITALQRAQVAEAASAAGRFRDSLSSFAGPETILEVVRPSLEKGKKLLLAIGPERGLVGSLHRDLASALGDLVRDRPDTSVLVSGSRLCSFLRKFSTLRFEPYPALSDRPQKDELRAQARFILEGRAAQRWQGIELLYPSWRSVTDFAIVSKLLFPLEVKRCSFGNDRPPGSFLPYFVEPSLETFTKRLEEMLLEAELYEVFLEARLVELSSRVLAATRAAENAKRLLGKLKSQHRRLERTRTTQAVNELFTGRKAFQIKKRRSAVALEWVV